MIVSRTVVPRDLDARRHQTRAARGRDRQRGRHLTQGELVVRGDRLRRNSASDSSRRLINPVRSRPAPQWKMAPPGTRAIAVRTAAMRSGLASRKGRSYSGVPFSPSPLRRCHRSGPRCRPGGSACTGSSRPDGRRLGRGNGEGPGAEGCRGPGTGLASSALRRSMTARIPAARAASHPAAVMNRVSADLISRPYRVKAPVTVGSPPRSGRCGSLPTELPGHDLDAVQSPCP